MEEIVECPDCGNEFPIEIEDQCLCPLCNALQTTRCMCGQCKIKSCKDICMRGILK